MRRSLSKNLYPRPRRRAYDGIKSKLRLYTVTATRVMERMIRDQYKGDLRLDWHAEGLACEIILPV